MPMATYSPAAAAITRGTARTANEVITLVPGGYWQRYAGGAGTITGVCYHGIGSYTATIFCDTYGNGGSGSATHSHNHSYAVAQ